MDAIEKNKPGALVDLPVGRRLEEEVYVTQPEGYVKANHPEKVYKLSKALYGLRQAPRAWNSKLDKFLKGLNFTRCGLKYGVYTRKQNGNVLIVGVYVDDLIVIGNCDGDVKYFKKQMNKEFEMSDMGLLSYYLGIEVTQHEDGITLKHSRFQESKKFCMEPTLHSNHVFEILNLSVSRVFEV
ncbi:ribonuclease H-like domain, reverse transcriptase, RNA-dependent DNA polymerase [Tanacetum coccineum]|uniref:Ribonuclease H-like domain, reverse transcriptase, RNA-dependent DNA polymerase n=1 Tax=Tanacetum coccineum TaxID=301880 RepID=A0ABQ5AXT6_9ASTR